jgi:hypothetical protein
MAESPFEIFPKRDLAQLFPNGVKSNLYVAAQGQLS